VSEFSELDYHHLRSEFDKRKLSFYRPYLKQQVFHKYGATKRERLLRSGNQMGKEQPVDEPVLTPNGWVNIGELKTGDEILAGDGAVTTVIGVYPQGIKPVFKVTFDDGAWTRCGEEHLWNARITRRERFGKDKDSDWPVYTLQQIREWGGDNPSPIKRAAIPVAHHANLEPQEIPLDPYLLGVLLGDGGWSHTSIVISSADKEIIDSVENVLPAGCELIKRPSRPYDWMIQLTGEGNRNPLRKILQNLGMDKLGAAQKFVPDCYLWNSDEVRLAVLQGLMDTDGSVDKSGIIEFSSISFALAENVIFLARSFGGKVKKEIRQTSYTYKGIKKKGKPSVRLRIRLPHVPVFRLTRKLNRCIKPVSTSDHRILYSIEPCGEAESVCIKVAHKSRTYITRDFIVTHNTLAAAAETAMHATGRYPDWWEGRRFNKAPVIWCAGVTGEVVRDSIQRLLVGDVANPGTGFIPPGDIVETMPSRGVADLLDTILVKHQSGNNSRIRLKYYEQGREKFQADTVDCVWLDEESDMGIYTESLTRTNATKGMLYMTFTPLKGMSEVVRRFLHEQSPDRIDVNMTIDDALHIAPEDRQKIINSYPVHERAARITGQPVLGSGRIFPIAEEDIACDPFDMASVPFYWQEIAGIDFGWNHPTAAVKLLYNTQDDIIYVTNVYKRKEATPIIHAAALRSWGKNIPWAWPHDGLQHDKGSGEQLSEMYRKQGLNMLEEHATFEDGGNSVEAGIAEMLMRMETGRLKVFRHLSEWFEEFRLYHRKEGKIFKEYEDLLDSTRYAIVMLRCAARVRKPSGTINGYPIEEDDNREMVRKMAEYNPLSREICRNIKR
jgi:phage terminase large subunit-like protein